MQTSANFFFKKKILIYGLGLSGISSLNFLKKNNSVKFYDDIKKFNSKSLSKFFIKKDKINSYKFDLIILSPGINFEKCGLQTYLKKNKKKIYTDLDIFYSYFNKNKIIAVTGTNGKSTTVQLLSDILNLSKKDARAVGNIGRGILNEKKISKNTIFVVETSSYQIEYSKIFKPNLALLLNISPDHLDRHKTFKNYLRSKLKLFCNQTEKDFAFFNKNNLLVKKEIRNLKINSSRVHVDGKLKNSQRKLITNNYLKTLNNEENLSFIFAVCKKLKIKEKFIFKAINLFKGLKFRQEIIYQSKKLTIINDSKSTSFSSSKNLLKSLNRVHWILGGLPKKGDKFIFEKNRKQKIKAYIFGSFKKFYINSLKNKIAFETFNNVKFAFKKSISEIKKLNVKKHQTILFSPCSASFDEFKNFEERGKYFNFLVKKEKIRI